MNKNEVKNILMSLRTPEYENVVNNLLGKIDLLSDEKLSTMVAKIGDSEESIREYLQKKLEEKHEHKREQHVPINDMFTYGIAGNSIHLHLPISSEDLMKLMKERGGISKTRKYINLKLLDAIEKIRNLKNDGYYKFQGKDSIYMISPILADKKRTQIEFLNKLDFKTEVYGGEELQDDKFVSEHPEAQLAVAVFGKESAVASAKIDFDVINSDEWQEKRKAQIEEFKEKGVELDQEEKKEV